MSSLGFHLQQLRGSLKHARTVDNESSRFAYSHKPSAGRSLAAIAQPQDFLSPVRDGCHSLVWSARAAWVVPNHVIQFIAGHADCCVTEKFKGPFAPGNSCLSHF